MKRITKKMLTLAAVTVFAAACDSTVQGPDLQQAPIQAQALYVWDLSGLSYALPTVSTYPAETTATAMIGRKGGEIAIADFATVRVPANAVKRETTFTITLVRDGFFEVELSAMQDWGQKTIDVGELGFAKPIMLKLNTDYLAGVYDLALLKLLWEVDGTRDGRLETVPDVSINANWLRADLGHFSKYVMASN